jgi:hypothetical protein
MEENNAAPLSRFAALCRTIDNVVGALEQDGNLFVSLRDQIDQLKEVAGTLQRIEGHDEPDMSLASAHRDSEPIYIGVSEGDWGGWGDKPYGERPDLRPRPRARPAARPGGRRYISHYPSSLIEKELQETRIVSEYQRNRGIQMSQGSQSNYEGQDDVEEERGDERGGTVEFLEEQREWPERRGRSRRRPESPRPYYEPERIRYRGHPFAPQPLPRARTFHLSPRPSDPEPEPEPKLLCGVDRASLDVDMRNPGWGALNKDHIIVAYYRDVPNQGPAGERHDEGSGRIRRQGTFNKTSKRPERIRINSELLVSELETITDVVCREFPVMWVSDLCPMSSQTDHHADLSHHIR